MAKKPLFVFFRGLGYISESCFQSELRKNNVFAEVEGSPINSMHDVLCLSKPFSASFVWNKAFVFTFVGTDSLITHSSLCFTNWTLNFCKSICWIQRLFAWLCWQGPIWKLRECLVDKLFRRRASETIWKRRFFGGQVPFCYNCLAYYPVSGFLISISGCYMHS